MPPHWATDDLVRYADTSTKTGRIQRIIKNMDKLINYRLDESVDNALIVSDTDVSPLLYHTMAGILSTHGVEPTINIIQQRKSPNIEPPSEIAESVKHTDVIINMCRYTITHTSAIEHARYNLNKDYILLADPTEDSFTRGAITADPEITDSFTEKVADVLQESSIIRVTSDYGTDVEMSTEGRDQIVAPFPMGETPTCPVEKTVNGTIVHESFMMGVGLLDRPITWEVEDGRIIDIKGGKEASALKKYIDEWGDENSYWIGEFSVQTQPKARPNGNYIEHKQVKGGVHIALGTGSDLGGEYRSSIHLDGIQLQPTVYADGNLIIEKGEFTI